MDGHGPTGDADLTGIGPAQAVDDAHERRLACPVLPEESVDLPAANVEVDAVVGEEVPESLGDAAQLERWRPVHFVARRLTGHALVRLVGGRAQPPTTVEPAGWVSTVSTREGPAP